MKVKLFRMSSRLLVSVAVWRVGHFMGMGDKKKYRRRNYRRGSSSSLQQSVFPPSHNTPIAAH